MNKLAQKRSEIDLSIEELSSILCVNATVLIDIENGKCIPTVDFALQIASVLNCKVEELFMASQNSIDPKEVKKKLWIFLTAIIVVFVLVKLFIIPEKSIYLSISFISYMINIVVLFEKNRFYRLINGLLKKKIVLPKAHKTLFSRYLTCVIASLVIGIVASYDESLFNTIVIVVYSNIFIALHTYFFDENI